MRAFKITTNIMNWIDTNTLITICTCAIGLTQFILWKHIAKVKAYEAEKGKNLATKEDIAGITKEIESVKASYNESLERHKMELQKEFEKTKYIINLCNTIDMSLTQLIAEAIKSNIDPEYDDRNIMYTAKGIYDFLHIHQARYGGNKVLDKLKDISFEIAKLLESDYPHISYDYKKIYIATLNEAASLFLLKFK
ncbi:hypothetical protein DUT93_04140 [Bacteroides xylanisolvens]|nr:hypothetical protein [Bacteroides xylanisolvens]